MYANVYCMAFILISETCQIRICSAGVGSSSRYQRKIIRQALKDSNFLI